jgi:hypothetical protein
MMDYKCSINYRESLSAVYHHWTAKNSYISLSSYHVFHCSNWGIFKVLHFISLQKLNLSSYLKKDHQTILTHIYEFIFIHMYKTLCTHVCIYVCIYIIPSYFSLCLVLFLLIIVASCILKHLVCMQIHCIYKWCA